ncbi:hypothetical protein [Paenibacillus xylanexedens]|uniref:hypothetical protein n=1 Tax=Paenibacillus xylanexedens TaxID=528191 RepID=UPI0011A2F283|nr:hypothetical protein [Paenibacillus xylanexedens]
MELLVAKRKIKKPCIFCNTRFKKGDCYWKYKVYIREETFSTHEWHWCPRCKYKEEDRAFRMMDLHMRCSHPPKFVHYEGDPNDYNGYVCGICSETHLIKNGEVYKASIDEVVWE